MVWISSFSVMGLPPSDCSLFYLPCGLTVFLFHCYLHLHIYMNIVNFNILTTKCAVNMYLACHENYIWKSLIHSDDSFSIVLFAFDELLFCIVSLFVFYCTVLYCIILYCILFYCIRTRFHEKEKGRCRLFVRQVDQNIFLSMFNIRFFLFTFSLYVF